MKWNEIDNLVATSKVVMRAMDSKNIIVIFKTVQTVFLKNFKFIFYKTLIFLYVLNRFDLKNYL